MMKRIRKIFFFFFLAAIFYGFNVPDPVGYVNDYAGILKDSTKSELEKLASNMSQLGMAEYAIVIVDRIEGGDEFGFAQAIFDKWKLGKKGLDNGVLLLVSIKDKKVRIHTGYGIEGIITDGEAGSILDNYLIPYFKIQDFDGGILNASYAIAKKIDKDNKLGNLKAIAKNKPVKNKTLKSNFLFFVFLFIVLINLFLLRLSNGGRYYRGGRWYGGGGFGGFGGGSGFGGFGGGMSGGGGAGRSW